MHVRLICPYLPADIYHLKLLTVIETLISNITTQSGFLHQQLYLLLKVRGGEDVVLVPGGGVLEYLGLRLSHFALFVFGQQMSLFCVSHEALPQLQVFELAT